MLLNVVDHLASTWMNNPETNARSGKSMSLQQLLECRFDHGTSHDLPPIFSPGIMRLSPVFVRPTCLSPQRGWGCGARGRRLRPLAPLHFCRSPKPALRTPLGYGTASCCADALRCSPVSTVRSSPSHRPDR